MDLTAAAAAGIRATRMSLLWAGWSCWRTWAGVTPRQAERTTTRPSGSGPTRQSYALDSELLASRRGTGRVVMLDHCYSF